MSFINTLAAALRDRTHASNKVSRRQRLLALGAISTVITGSMGATLDDVTMQASGTEAPPPETPAAAAEADLPGLVLKAIITLGGSTDEGRLVEAVSLPWWDMVRLFAKDPDGIYQVSPRVWEELVAGAYKTDGYEVILTPRSGDKGRDVIAVKKGFGSIRIIDQVKAYRPGHVVTADEVRALIGTLSLDPKASKAVLTTTSVFAPRLREDEGIRRMEPFRLELKERDDLLEWLELLRKTRDST